MAIRYVPYTPDPVAGQALLDNFLRTQRILRYRDSDKVAERIVRGMPFYEVTDIEKVGDDASDNMIIHGECVSACAYLKEQGIKVDLVYIDPPFASGADYAKDIYIRRNPLLAKELQKAGQELDNEELKAFEEKMYGDIWDKEKYLNWMYENLMAIRSVMSENASIFVHLDYNIGHYVKILLDEVFGEACFLNNIVWCYQTRQFSKNYFNRKHHDIFWYCKNPDAYTYNWNDPNVLQGYSEATIKKYKYKDEKGFYRLCGRGITGSPIKGAKDVDPKWEISHPELVVRDYLGNGFAPSDYWMIDIVNQAANERVDYATQKPEALLMKIISAASNEGFMVADFFGGSGVAAAVAAKTGRKFIHADININSIQTARDRLKANGASFSVKKVQDGVTLYRNPIQTKNAITRIIPGLRVDPTIGSMWTGCVMDTTYGSSPVYIPDLQDSSSRVLDTATLSRIINDAMPQLDPATKRVIIYYIDMADRQELDDFIKDNNDTLIEIELRDLKEMLDNLILQDDVEYTICEDTSKIADVFTITIKRFYSDRVGHKINEFNQKAMANPKKKSVHIELSPEGLEAIEMLSLDCTTADPEDKTWHSDSEIKIEKDNTVTINGHKTSDFWDGTIHSESKPLRMKIRNICGDETIIALSSEQ